MMLLWHLMRLQATPVWALIGHSGARISPAFASHCFHGFLVHLYPAEVCLGVTLDISASRAFTLTEFASSCPAGWRKWGCTGKPQNTCQFFWMLSSQSQLPFSTMYSARAASAWRAPSCRGIACVFAGMHNGLCSRVIAMLLLAPPTQLFFLFCFV